MRAPAAGLVPAACTFISLTAQPPSPLESARTLLTGEHKDTKTAADLLLQFVRQASARTDPESLAYAYVYLGYIEDRARNRRGAAEWLASLPLPDRRRSTPNARSGFVVRAACSTGSQ